MENTDYLIEKYKNEMLKMKQRAAANENGKAERIEAVPVSSGKANSGTLKVYVFAGNPAYPIESAFVSVRDKSGRVLYSRYTNSSGIADDMVLSAPNTENSQSPDMENPYYEYTVEVKHPTYLTTIKSNVQIFPDTESIQPFNLQIDNQEAK